MKIAALVEEKEKKAAVLEKELMTVLDATATEKDCSEIKKEKELELPRPKHRNRYFHILRKLCW